MELNLIIYGGRSENLFGRLLLFQESNPGFPCCRIQGSALLSD